MPPPRLPILFLKNGVIIIYLNVVLLERTILKPRLTQSNDIKLVLLKHDCKLVKCRHYSLDVIRWAMDVCLKCSFSF